MNSQSHVQSPEVAPILRNPTEFRSRQEQMTAAPEKLSPIRRNFDSFSPQEIRRMKPIELTNLYLSSQSKKALNIVVDPELRYVIMETMGQILELRHKQNRLYELTAFRAPKDTPEFISLKLQIEEMSKDLYHKGRLPRCFFEDEEFLFDINDIRQQSKSEPLVYKGEKIQIGLLRSHNSFKTIDINQLETATPHTAAISLRDVRTIIEKYEQNPSDRAKNVELLKTALRFANIYTKLFTDRKIYLGGLQNFDPDDISQKNYEIAYANLRIITGFGQLLEEADEANLFNADLSESTPDEQNENKNQL